MPAPALLVIASVAAVLALLFISFLMVVFGEEGFLPSSSPALPLLNVDRLSILGVIGGK